MMTAARQWTNFIHYPLAGFGIFISIVSLHLLPGCAATKRGNAICRLTNLAPTTAARLNPTWPADLSILEPIMKRPVAAPAIGLMPLREVRQF